MWTAYAFAAAGGPFVLAKLLAFAYPQHSAAIVLVLLTSLAFTALHLTAAHNMVRWARNRSDMGLDGFGYPWEVRSSSALVCSSQRVTKHFLTQLLQGSHQDVWGLGMVLTPRWCCQFKICRISCAILMLQEGEEAWVMLGCTGGLGGVSAAQDVWGEDVSPRALADADSQFIGCGSMSVHVKEAAPPVSRCFVASRAVQFAAHCTPQRCAAVLSVLLSASQTGCFVHTLIVTKMYTFHPPSQAGEGLSDVGIVLIHGYGSGVFAWRHIMWPLARKARCRVIAFDRPAFGALACRQTTQ